MSKAEAYDAEELPSVYPIPKDDFLSFIDPLVLRYAESSLQFEMLAELYKPKNRNLFGVQAIAVFIFVDERLAALPLSSENPYEVFLSLKTSEFCASIEQERFVLKFFQKWFDQQIATISTMVYDSTQTQEHYTAQKELFQKVRSLIKAKRNNYKSPSDPPTDAKPNQPIEYTFPTMLAKAGNHLRFFLGQNPVSKERICKDEEIAPILFGMGYFIEYGVIPKDLKPVGTLRISNEYVLHTCYLIHKELWGGKINRNFIEFIKCLFSQIRGTETDTIYKKWAKAPVRYHMDLPIILEGLGLTPSLDILI